MYGLINRAVEDLVRSKFGADAWHRIRTRAGLPDEPFVTMQKYDDKSTYDLVGAASAELGAPAEAILEEFGFFWTVYSANAGYGELLKSVGRTLPEFLGNLDQMHARIKISFPELDPPSFAVFDRTPSSLKLRYYSDRAGLAPLVRGMLRGLGDRFMVDIEMTNHRVEDNGRAHDLFDVSWKERAGAPSRA
ncbi:MAG: heme NO-binding domain-containing protein [Planctomycetaceae bacterium]|nr:heme NO-binding domain-containing protein [Planctomycetaceae bacterium]